MTAGNRVLILDAMAILQTIKTISSTFGELAHKLLIMVVEIAVKSEAKRVDFECERYPAQSIKDFERAIRGERGTQLIKIFSSLQNVPRQWRKFITAGESKEELIKFPFKYWSEECDPQLLRGVEDLESDQEEAGTRMLAHAKNASAGYPIIIRSPDTDVFAIALMLACQFIRIYISRRGQKIKGR